MDKHIPKQQLWLIWSNEHNAWWAPNQRGYSVKRYNAGTYTFEDAKSIVTDANKYCIDQPNEAMVPY